MKCIGLSAHTCSGRHSQYSCELLASWAPGVALHRFCTQLLEQLDSLCMCTRTSCESIFFLFSQGWIYYLQMQYSDALPCFMRSV